MMKIAGIVAEYNPFHGGHRYQLAQTKQHLAEGGLLLCVMSGNWVQRGESAITDKWHRTKMALAGGADLVLELPTPWAMASAETFARGSISLLTAAGIDGLSFGCESGGVAPLRRVAQCLDTPLCQQAIGGFMEGGISYAAARQRGVAHCLGETAAQVLATPNNNLAVEYLRALPAHITPLAIQRIGAHHDRPGGGAYPAASTLRQLLRAGDVAGANQGLTAPWQGEWSDLAWCQRGILARLRTVTTSDLAAVPDSGDGLAERLVKAARQGGTLEEVYALAKTKRLAHARIRRVAMWTYLGLTAGDGVGLPGYLRVLGMTAGGATHLARLKETCPLPIITKPAQHKQLLALESRLTDLYGLTFPTPRPCGLEYTTSPVFWNPA